MAAHRDQHRNVVFQQFPADPDLLLPDLRPYVQEIVQRHGPEEWRLCVLTSEIHRHLGIYSVAGTKMGLRAMEILDASLDELQVVSYAGTQPPLSCLNDGLQVATGATLGHGTISVAGSADTRPEATVTRGGRAIRLRLRAEYEGRVQADVARGIEEHGNLTPAYFYFIRHLAIRYWLDWDRREIFEVEALD